MQFTAAIVAAILAVPSFAAPSGGPGKNHGGVMTFLGRLNAARNTVEKASGSEDLKLWHATATASNGQPVTDVFNLDHIDAVFVTDDEEGTAYSVSEGQYGEFSAPQEQGTSHGITGAGMISLSDEVQVDLAQAYETIQRQTGDNGMVQSVELAHRITRFTSDQPYYFFEMTGGNQYAVGATNGKLAQQN